MAIPQNITTPEDGGHVVRTTPLELVSPSVLNAVAAITLAQANGGIVQTGLENITFPKITGELEASAISEGANYTLQGVDFDSETISLVKLGLAMQFSNEYLRSLKAVNGISQEILNRVDQAFANAWDSNILGLAAGSAQSSAFEFDFETSVTDTVELTDTNDGIRKAVSQAIGEIYEETGRNANAVIVSSDAPQLLRDARVSSTEDNNGLTVTNAPLYAASADPLYGLASGVSKNLARLGDNVAGSTVMVVGDFSTLRVLLGSSVETETSTIASMDGTSGFESDMVFQKWRQLGNVYATDERCFRRIVIPAGS